MSIQELERLERLENLFVSITKRLGNKTPNQVRVVVSLLEKYKKYNKEDKKELKPDQRRKLYDFLRMAESSLLNLEKDNPEIYKELERKDVIRNLVWIIEDFRRDQEEKKESKAEKSEEK